MCPMPRKAEEFFLFLIFRSLIMMCLVMDFSGFILFRVHLTFWLYVVKTCPTLCGPMDCNLLVSSVHRIFQARILEWVAISFSRGSSQSRHQTCISCISCIDRQILYHCTSWDCIGLWLLPSLGNLCPIWGTVFIQILFQLYALFYFWSSENKEIRSFIIVPQVPEALLFDVFSVV